MKHVKGYFGLINEYYSRLLANEVIIAFDGDITHQVMKAFASLVEEKLEKEKEDESIRRKVYHILVECLQNINRHAEDLYLDENDKYPGRGALLVSKSNSHYRLITANIIKNSGVSDLKSFLNTINHMSAEELNSLYKKQLMEGEITAKGGAGLGFIDIRRKTGNEMEYNFLENDEDTSFFLINITVTR